MRGMFLEKVRVDDSDAKHWSAHPRIVRRSEFLSARPIR